MTLSDATINNFVDKLPGILTLIVACIGAYKGVTNSTKLDTNQVSTDKTLEKTTAIHAVVVSRPEPGEVNVNITPPTAAEAKKK